MMQICSRSGRRSSGDGLMLEIVNIFLNTEFEGGGRHKRRVDKIAAIEEKYFK